MKPRFFVPLFGLVTLLVPPFLILLGLRLLLTPAFLEIEYRLPAFPPDSYGFTLDDRLRWSKIALEYLLDDADIDFLADLRLADRAPLYNPRELQHMLDVKALTQAVQKVFYAVVALLAVLGICAWRWGGAPAYRRGLRRGGWLTAALVLAIALLGALSFWQFFTLFHQIFFEGDSWLFLYSDTLIRLFPMRFWQDCFIFVGGLALLGGLALGLGLKEKRPAQS